VYTQIVILLLYMKKLKKAIVHGECVLFSSRLPAEAEQEQIESNYVVIANSEVTGNHHVVDLKPGVNVYKKGSRRFIKNSVETTVRCAIADRHNDIKLSPGTWEIDFQQEYDYFSESMRNVRD